MDQSRWRAGTKPNRTGAQPWLVAQPAIGLSFAKLAGGNSITRGHGSRGDEGASNAADAIIAGGRREVGQGQIWLVDWFCPSLAENNFPKFSRTLIFSKIFYLQ